MSVASLHVLADTTASAVAAESAQVTSSNNGVTLESGFMCTAKAIDAYVSLNSQLQKFIKVLKPEHQDSLASLTEQYVDLCQQFGKFLALTKSGMLTLSRSISRYTKKISGTAGLSVWNALKDPIGLMSEPYFAANRESVTELETLSKKIIVDCAKLRTAIHTCEDYDENCRGKVIGGILIAAASIGIITSGVLLAPFTFGGSAVAAGLAVGGTSLVGLGGGVAVLVLSAGKMEEIRTVLQNIRTIEVNAKKISAGLAKLSGSMTAQAFEVGQFLDDCREVGELCAKYEDDILKKLLRMPCVA